MPVLILAAWILELFFLSLKSSCMVQPAEVHLWWQGEGIFKILSDLETLRTLIAVDRRKFMLLFWMGLSQKKQINSSVYPECVMYAHQCAIHRREGGRGGTMPALQRIISWSERPRWSTGDKTLGTLHYHSQEKILHQLMLICRCSFICGTLTSLSLSPPLQALK